MLNEKVSQKTIERLIDEEQTKEEYYKSCEQYGYGKSELMRIIRPTPKEKEYMEVTVIYNIK